MAIVIRIDQKVDSTFCVKYSYVHRLALIYHGCDSAIIFMQYGSAVKFPGSGGAVIGLCLDNHKKVWRSVDSCILIL